MPVGTGTPSSADGAQWGGSVGHENGVSISFSATAELTGINDGDEAVQDLIDYLAAWPKLHSTNGVTASRSLVYGYPITVTEP